MTKLSQFACAVAAASLVAAQPASATRSANALPTSTWVIVEDEADEFSDFGCIELSGASDLPPGPVPEADEETEIRVDENNRPILDSAGNFIGCETAPTAGWLSGPTLYILGALVVGQIIAFASSGGDSNGNPSGPNDSPG